MILREHWRNLIGHHLLEHNLVLNLTTTLGRTTVKSSCPLGIYDLPLRPCLFNFLSLNHEKMLLCRVSEWHSSWKSSDTPVTNLFISTLGWETKEGAYFENWLNFKEYLGTLIPPWKMLINSTNLVYLFFLGKNLSIKSFLNTSQVTGPSLYGLLSLRWTYPVWATLLSC